MNEIIVAVITSVLGLVGVIVSNNYSNKKIMQQVETAQAVTDTKVDELTREVREHNGFARRMPVCECEIDNLKSRVEKLEKE